MRGKETIAIENKKSPNNADVVAHGQSSCRSRAQLTKGDEQLGFLKIREVNIHVSELGSDIILQREDGIQYVE